MKWPKNGPYEMKWPKNGQNEMKWPKMVQNKGEIINLEYAREHYQISPVFELEQYLAFRRNKDKLTSLFISMIQGAHSKLCTLEKKISSQPINQSLLAIKQIKINIRKD